MITFPFNDCWIYTQNLNLNLEEIENKIYEFERRNPTKIQIAPKINKRPTNSFILLMKKSRSLSDITLPLDFV